MKREDDRMNPLKADALRGFFGFRHPVLIVRYLLYKRLNVI